MNSISVDLSLLTSIEGVIGFAELQDLRAVCASCFSRHVWWFWVGAKIIAIGTIDIGTKMESQSYYDGVNVLLSIRPIWAPGAISYKHNVTCLASLGQLEE